MSNFTTAVENAGIDLGELLTGIIGALASAKNPAYSTLISQASQVVVMHLESVKAAIAPTNTVAPANTRPGSPGGAVNGHYVDTNLPPVVTSTDSTGVVTTSIGSAPVQPDAAVLPVVTSPVATTQVVAPVTASSPAPSMADIMAAMSSIASTVKSLSDTVANMQAAKSVAAPAVTVTSAGSGI